MATLKKFNTDPDYGMQMADDSLQELEKRINHVYREAATEVTQNLNRYMAQFEAMDEEMRGKMNLGEISEDEYNRWRFNRMMRNQQMAAQVDKLTNDMVNADKLAVAMINNDLPGVYCNGYNFAGFKGEMMAQAAGYNYVSFSIYNTEAMRIILTEDPDLIPWQPPKVNIPADKAWNRKHIQNAIAQGILQGDSIPDLSKRLLPIVNMDRNAATRTARTAYTAVQNEGRRDATKKIQEAGIPMQEPWMALLAPNTRDTHLMLHGTLPNEKGLYGEGIIPTGNLLRFPADPKGDPEQIYNCRCRVNSFLPGIDHTKDDELYEKMMREEFYDDWVGDKNAQGVSQYKIAEQKEALERKKKLDSGEIKPRGAGKTPIPKTTPTAPTPTPTAQAAPVTPAYRVATNKKEAKDILENDLGFSKVSPSAINKIDEGILCEQVNQLSKLNATFGNLTSGMEFQYGKMQACAYVRSSYYRGPEALKLSSTYFNDDADLLGNLRKAGIEKKWWMPLAPENYNVGTITHEYGHILQNTLISEAWSTSDALNAQLFHNATEGLQRLEIIQIAKDANPDFNLMDNISGYGKKNNAEFFAEVFSNAMGGDPNELGNAMRTWLERQGYTL